MASKRKSLVTTALRVGILASTAALAAGPAAAQYSCGNLNGCSFTGADECTISYICGYGSQYGFTYDHWQCPGGEIVSCLVCCYLV